MRIIIPCIIEGNTTKGSGVGSRRQSKNISISLRDLILCKKDLDKVVTHSLESNEEISFERDLGDNVKMGSDVRLFR